MNASPDDAESQSPSVNALAHQLQAGPSTESTMEWTELVDHGSWPRFESSLERFLAQTSHPGLMVLLTAPAPVVRPDYLPRRHGALSLFRLMRTQPSQEIPGLILTLGTSSVQVAIPVQDADGRYLLDSEQITTLQAFGWGLDEDVLTRIIAPSGDAATAVTRVLLDVLRVPHPADLDYLLRQQ